MSKKSFIFYLFFFIVTTLNAQDRGKPLNYNAILTIEPTSFPGQLIWTNGASRYVTGAVQIPNNHAELLVGPSTDIRQQIGSQFFIFQAKENPKNSSIINYGDEIEILSPAGGYGVPGLAGVYIPMKKWWVNDGASKSPGITNARQNQASIYDIIVSDPQHPQTKDGSQLFKIISPFNYQGHVYQNDPVALASLGPRDCKNRRLWCQAGSRFGKGFNEILVSPPTAQQVVTQGMLRIKTVDKTTLSPEAKALYNIAQGEAPPAPGGSAFTFIPGVQGSKNVLYHPLWKLQAPGKGAVSFTASAKSDIYINLSAQPQDVPGALYQIIIGEANNTKTTIRKDPSKPPVFEDDITKGGNPNAVITGGIGNKSGNGTEWDDYWIYFDNGTISFGKDLPVGKTVLFSWKDPAPNNQIQYVGLGGDAYLVNFKNIALKDSSVVVNPPKGFNDDGEAAQAIAVGSKKDGTIDAWSISDEDLALYHYDPASTLPNPWVKEEAKDRNGNVISTFSDVAASSDGIAGAVSTLGKIYLFEPIRNVWVEIPAKNASTLKFSKLAIGNDNNIWALEGTTGNLYQLVRNKPRNMANNSLILNINEWEFRLPNCIAVAAGFDNTVVVINNNNLAMKYENQKWIDLPGAQLTRIAVASKDLIVGTCKRDNVFEIWQYSNKVWQKPIGADGKQALGFDAIGINAIGIIFGIDADGNIYNNGDDGVIFKILKPATITPVPGKLPLITPAIRAPVVPMIKSKRTIARQQGLIKKVKTRKNKRVIQKIGTMPSVGQKTATAFPDVNQARRAGYVLQS